MKKTFEIRSVDIIKADGYYYRPISQYVKQLYDMWMSCGLECIGMWQRSDQHWKIRLKGKKKDIQKFVYYFSINASTHYTLSETIW